MIPREIVGTIADRIEDLDFGYESENTPADTWRASLDIALRLGLITLEQSQAIVDEDAAQATLELQAQRIRRKLEWDALTPEQQERRRFMQKSFQAQNEVLKDIVTRQVLNLAFKMPGV